MGGGRRNFFQSSTRRPGRQQLSGSQTCEKDTRVSHDSTYRFSPNLLSVASLFGCARCPRPPAIESLTRNPFDPSPPENHVPERQTSASLQRGRGYRCLFLHQIFNSSSQFPPRHRKAASLPKLSLSRVHRWEMEQLVAPLARSPVGRWLSTAPQTFLHFFGFQVSVLSLDYFPHGFTRTNTSAQALHHFS